MKICWFCFVLSFGLTFSSQFLVLLENLLNLQLAILVFKCLFIFVVVRYVDMIANPEVADVFRKRAKVVHLPILIPQNKCLMFCNMFRPLLTYHSTTQNLPLLIWVSLFLSCFSFAKSYTISLCMPNPALFSFASQILHYFLLYCWIKLTYDLPGIFCSLLGCGSLLGVCW